MAAAEGRIDSQLLTELRAASERQIDRWAVPTSVERYRAKAYYDLRRVGLRGIIPVTVLVTGDDLVYCLQRSGERLVWCASFLPPNAYVIRQGALWFTRVGETTYDPGPSSPYSFMWYSPFGAMSPFTTRSRITALLRGRRLARLLAGDRAGRVQGPAPPATRTER